MKTFYINGTILTMEENNLYAEAGLYRKWYHTGGGNESRIVETSE